MTIMHYAGRINMCARMLEARPVFIEGMATPHLAPFAARLITRARWLQIAPDIFNEIN